jgi:hypothetical protein
MRRDTKELVRHVCAKAQSHQKKRRAQQHTINELLLETHQSCHLVQHPVNVEKRRNEFKHEEHRSVVHNERGEMERQKQK